MAKANLKEFVEKYRGCCDCERRYLFSKDTEKVVLEQVKKVKYIQDPENFEIYLQVKPTPKSKNGLTRWISKHPESGLEQFHGMLAHFGNTGMSEGVEMQHLARPEPQIARVQSLVMQ